MTILQTPLNIAQLYIDISKLRSRTDKIGRLQRKGFVAQLLMMQRYADYRHLCHFEAQVYSQHGEDGIISELCRRVGMVDRCFVEIGVGNGRECNTLYLLSQHWRGYWFEAEPSHVDRIQSDFARDIQNRDLTATRVLMTAETAAATLRQSRVPYEFDVLSIDIDLNTSHIWRALGEYRPRIAVIEYNASIPKGDEWEVEYEPDGTWDGSVYFGASLRTLQSIGEAQGYSLVGCELSGTNAFFVRTDLIDDQFMGPFTAVALYEPPRYYLVGDWGHRRRYGKSRIRTGDSGAADLHVVEAD